MKLSLLWAAIWLGSLLMAYGQGLSSEIWTAEEWEKARSFSPLPLPPPDPSNRLSGNDEAARLGQRLFFDPRLSPKNFSCASCHRPEMGFSDGLAVANTIAPLHRNTMTLLNVGYYRWLTWDGARDSLWHQALAPIENPKEMGSSRLHVVKTVMRHYKGELVKLVRLPEGWNKLWPRLPDFGQPGDSQFDRLRNSDKEKVNRVFASVLKVIAAYERKIISGRSPFDRFVAGERQALSDSAQKGFQHFLRFGCDRCHNTPLFSDDDFHNLGLSSSAAPDNGRYDGLSVVKSSRFRGTGPYADGAPVIDVESYSPGKTLIGAFRTPSLRELRYTAPYGHNGTVKTLEDWMKHYTDVTTTDNPQFIGSLDPSLPRIEMTEAEKNELVEFLMSLSSDYRSSWTPMPENRRSSYRR
ncbi:MAG TPA: cytochrome c peroxidase [Candidatus Binatia bacterium]|jgi:cytochrome c peroxidase